MKTYQGPAPFSRYSASPEVLEALAEQINPFACIGRNDATYNLTNRAAYLNMLYRNGTAREFCLTDYLYCLGESVRKMQAILKKTPKARRNEAYQSMVQNIDGLARKVEMDIVIRNAAIRNAATKGLAKSLQNELNRIENGTFGRNGEKQLERVYRTARALGLVRVVNAADYVMGLAGRARKGLCGERATVVQYAGNIPSSRKTASFASYARTAAAAAIAGIAGLLGCGQEVPKPVSMPTPAYRQVSEPSKEQPKPSETVGKPAAECVKQIKEVQSQPAAPTTNAPQSPIPEPAPSSTKSQPAALTTPAPAPATPQAESQPLSVRTPTERAPQKTQKPEPLPRPEPLSTPTTQEDDGLARLMLMGEALGSETFDSVTGGGKVILNVLDPFGIELFGLYSDASQEFEPGRLDSESERYGALLTTNLELGIESLLHLSIGCAEEDRDFEFTGPYDNRFGNDALHKIFRLGFAQGGNLYDGSVLSPASTRILGTYAKGKGKTRGTAGVLDLNGADYTSERATLEFLQILTGTPEENLAITGGIGYQSEYLGKEWLNEIRSAELGLRYQFAKGEAAIGAEATWRRPKSRILGISNEDEFTGLKVTGAYKPADRVTAELTLGHEGSEDGLGTYALLKLVFDTGSGKNKGDK